MSETEAVKKNIVSIQILRGVAAASVVYWHIGVAPEFGSFGVDIFFSISGFVMALITDGSPRPSRFLIDRISRIVPLYWVLTTGLLIAIAVYPNAANSTTFNLQDYFKSLFFIPYLRENGKMFPLLFVGWTLNYEMCFYACLSISLVVYKRHPLILTSLILTAAFFIFGRWIKNHTLNAFFGNTQIFEFILGMAAYKVYRSPLLRRWPRRLSVGLGVSSYAFMAVTQAQSVQFEVFFLCGIPSFLLIISAVQLENSIGGRVAGFLKSVGDASYATYLSHAFVVDGTIRIISNRYGLIDPYAPVGILVIMSAALIVGHVIYRTIDRPASHSVRMKLVGVMSISNHP